MPPIRIEWPYSTALAFARWEPLRDYTNLHIQTSTCAPLTHLAAR